MNVNQKIENTLGVITENIWPLCCPYESPPGKYIVYNPEIDSAECFTDDEDQEWTLHMQIHLYTREDYMDDRKTIRKYTRKKQNITICAFLAILRRKTDGLYRIGTRCRREIQ